MHWVHVTKVDSPVQTSKGFGSRSEAGRYATALARLGKADKVEITREPDETLLETLERWRETYATLATKARVPGNKKLAADLDRAIGALVYGEETANG